MYLDDLLANLKKGPLPPVVLLSGKAEDTKAEALSRVKAAFRSRHPGGRVIFLEGEPEDLIGAVEGARTASLFREVEMTVLLNAQKALADENASTALAEYLQSPSEDRYLVFLTAGGRKDSRSTAALKKGAWSVDCTTLAEWKASDWVVQRAAERGLGVDKATAQELLAVTGPDVTCIRQALDALADSVRPRTRLQSSDLSAVPIPSSAPEIFPLQDALGRRQADECLSLMEREAGGDRPLISPLYQRVRDLLGIALARARGLDAKAVGAALGLNDFRMRALWGQAVLYQPDELKRMLKDLMELQTAALTGRLGKSSMTQALEAWILLRVPKK